ncbi:hypothetical protein TNCV_509011 [Trichonephila clavipes]|nr:hypothetical protein TNCV_509011 [Trichonephila clavipes]
MSHDWATHKRSAGHIRPAGRRFSISGLDLYARRLVMSVPLTTSTMKVRLSRSRKHQSWTPQEWGVLFSVISRSEDLNPIENDSVDMERTNFYGRLPQPHPQDLKVALLEQFASLPQIRRMAQNEIAVVPDFHKRIMFSEEAHFWLNGYVNKQNCRIWSEANPQVYVETPLHAEKLTVWCAL